MKCKPWIRHFSPPEFQCFSSQFALHGLRALENTLTKKGFGTINFYKINCAIILQSKFLRMFSCKQGQSSGSNITKKMLWWNHFCNHDKDYYKNKCSKDLFCNNFGQDGMRIWFFLCHEHVASRKYPLDVPPTWCIEHERDHDDKHLANDKLRSEESSGSKSNIKQRRMHEVEFCRLQSV